MKKCEVMTREKLFGIVLEVLAGAENYEVPILVTEFMYDVLLDQQEQSIDIMAEILSEEREKFNDLKEKYDQLQQDYEALEDEYAGLEMEFDELVKENSFTKFLNAALDDQLNFLVDHISKGDR